MALVTLGFALPVAAQNNTMTGKVTDVKGAPIEGATITIEQPSTGRKYETKSGKDGGYTQIGLTLGLYVVTVTKEGVGTSKDNINVRGGRTIPVDWVIGLTAAEGMSKSFNEGVAASAAGNFDEAIAKFNEVLAVNSLCSECYTNIGIANVGKKDYDAAEAAYKKSIEIKPSAGAYNGLVGVYTAQRKFDKAEEASKHAAELSVTTPGGTASPEAIYTQGVVAFNGGNLAEAKQKFQSTIAAKPDHAEAHYQLGNVFVGEGNFADAVKEFETYLQLAPSGPNVKAARDNVAALKPLVK
ncbi:MAG: tetratricopeptide repeat protein [Vicinamibacterales bacterium]|nr:tetratricopeptide repeat protein [Vicinamibacterales bacterium]